MSVVLALLVWALRVWPVGEGGPWHPTAEDWQFLFLFAVLAVGTDISLAIRFRHPGAEQPR